MNSTDLSYFGFKQWDYFQHTDIQIQSFPAFAPVRAFSALQDIVHSLRHKN